MTNVVAEFDGKVFVPCQPVDLPAGTQVTIRIPAHSSEAPSSLKRPPPTPQQRQEWERLMRELNATEPYFPTVEDAIGYSRRYPGYYP
jgi:hypothetical protein